MSIKRWWVTAIAAVLTVAALVIALNILVDPFGVFGDKILDWYSFNMTMAPKAAKTAYLNERSDEYNAYVIGPSGSSSFLPETLNKYTDLRWYNTFNYGADMEYTLQLAHYIADNYEAREFLLVLPYVSAAKFGTPPEDSTQWPSPSVTGAASDWLRFLTANPRNALMKLKNYRENSYLQEKFDVFLPESGVYDKSSRDSEPIGSLADYAGFPNDYVEPRALAYLDECMDAVRELRQLCDERGIALTVIVPPMPAMRLAEYDASEVDAFYARLGEITPYYDYAHFVPNEPRYYYDESHFRNNVGDMVLADIYGDESGYIYADGDELDAELMVLLYHDITDEQVEDATSVADFRRDMEHIRDAGYTTVSLSEIEDYVYRGVALPEKAVLIRFDDGYTSNYELALPILEEFGHKAVIFAIGVSVGRDTYKDTGEPITPHFTFEQAREMLAGGLIEVQSHTYDMHQVSRLDGVGCRFGVLRLDGESEADYVAALTADFERSRSELEAGTGAEVYALAYPYGNHEKLAEVVLYKLGVRMTFTIEHGRNTLVKGLPQSLYNLKICNITDLK